MQAAKVISSDQHRTSSAVISSQSLWKAIQAAACKEAATCGRAALRSHSGVTQESLRSHSGVTQESLRRHSGVTQESLRSHSGGTQESLRSHSGVTQESLRRHSAGTQRPHLHARAEALALGDVPSLEHEPRTVELERVQGEGVEGRLWRLGRAMRVQRRSDHSQVAVSSRP